MLDSDYCFDDDGMYPSVNYNEEDPHRSYMESIESMPMTAGPGVFGLHENANIACALAETFVIFDTVLLMEVRHRCIFSASGEGRNNYNSTPLARLAKALRETDQPTTGEVHLSENTLCRLVESERVSLCAEFKLPNLILGTHACQDSATFMFLPPSVFHSQTR